MKNIVLILLLSSATAIAANGQALPARLAVMLKDFKLAVKSGDSIAVSNMIRFPLPTSISAEGLSGGRPTDFVGKSDFHLYSAAIFHRDLIRILSGADGKAISLVGPTDGKYFRLLQESIDRTGALYEIYIQYQQSGSNAESYFGMVFGQVSGKYKLVGYYAKWPIR